MLHGLHVLTPASMERNWWLQSEFYRMMFREDTHLLGALIRTDPSDAHSRVGGLLNAAELLLIEVEYIKT